jgi:uncharacterized protein (DUF488 family)
MKGINNPVYTIGHSTHSMEAFVALLRKTRLDAIADIRSTPYSRWRPHFNRDILRNVLTGHGIAYVFLGVELGGRGVDDSERDENGRTKYQKIAGSAAFREGLRRVHAGSQRMRLALMCAENDPLECHRGILVSRFLVSRDTQVLHIHGDGRVESHREAEQRLRQIMELAEPDLFRTEDQILADAYERQEARIAYVEPNVAAEGSLTR